MVSSIIFTLYFFGLLVLGIILTTLYFCPTPYFITKDFSLNASLYFEIKLEIITILVSQEFISYCGITLKIKISVISFFKCKSKQITEF